MGSVTALTNAKGKVVQTYDYDSFGNLKNNKNRIKQPYTFTGREYDRETGLYYYRARYYDPVIGRFISKDPIGFAGGDVNLYRYVFNSPTNHTDPKGLCTWDGAITGISGGVYLGGGGYILTIKSECSECKEASGVYLALAAGGTLGAPIGVSATPISMEGPSKPHEDQPVGSFKIFSVTGSIFFGGSFTTVASGSLKGDISLSPAVGLDASMDLFFGRTYKISGVTRDCN